MSRFNDAAHKALFEEIQNDMHDLLEDFGKAMRTSNHATIEKVVANIGTSIMPSITELRKRGSQLRKRDQGDLNVLHTTRDREKKLEIHATRLRGACYKFLGQNWNSSAIKRHESEKSVQSPGATPNASPSKSAARTTPSAKLRPSSPEPAPLDTPPPPQPTTRPAPIATGPPAAGASGPAAGGFADVDSEHDSDDSEDHMAEGDRAFRKGRACVIVKIDESMAPPSYIVRMEDTGNEVNTELSRLSRYPQPIATKKSPGGSAVKGPRKGSIVTEPVYRRNSSAQAPAQTPPRRPRADRRPSHSEQHSPSAVSMTAQSPYAGEESPRSAPSSPDSIEPEPYEQPPPGGRADARVSKELVPDDALAHGLRRGKRPSTSRTGAKGATSQKGKVPWIRSLFPSGSDNEDEPDEQPEPPTTTTTTRANRASTRRSRPAAASPRRRRADEELLSETYTHETMIDADRESGSGDYPDMPGSDENDDAPARAGSTATSFASIAEASEAPSAGRAKAPALERPSSLNDRLSRIMSSFKQAQKRTSVTEFGNIDVDAMGITDLRNQISEEKSHVEKLRSQLRSTMKEGITVTRETGEVQSLVANFKVRQEAAVGPHRDAHRAVQAQRLALHQLPSTIEGQRKAIEGSKAEFQRDIRARLAELVVSQQELQRVVDEKRAQIAELQQSVDAKIAQERQRYLQKKQSFLQSVQQSQQRLASESTGIKDSLSSGLERLGAERGVLMKDHDGIKGQLTKLRSSLDTGKSSLRGHAQMLVDKRVQLDSLAKRIQQKQEHCQNVLVTAQQHVADLESIRSPVQELFDEAGRALQDARDRLAGVSHGELAEVSRMSSPTKDVLDCFTMAFRLIGRGEVKWRTMKNELRKPRVFKKSLLEFEAQDIKPEDRDIIKKYLKDPRLMQSRGIRQYKLCGAMLTWMRALAELAEVRKNSMSKLVHLYGEILSKSAQRDALKRGITHLDEELLACTESHKALSEEYLDAKTSQDKQLTVVTGVEGSLAIVGSALQEDLKRAQEQYEKLQTEQTSLESQLRIETPSFEEDEGLIGIYPSEETSSSSPGEAGKGGFLPFHMRKDIAELKGQLSFLEEKMMVNTGTGDPEDDEAVQIIRLWARRCV